MARTKIEWATESWNCVTGCTPVSEGCTNCYAKGMHKRLVAMGVEKYRHDFKEVHTHYAELSKRISGKNKLVFVNSMSDTFHQDVPTDFHRELYHRMHLQKDHTFLILTKRAKRMYFYNNNRRSYEYRVNGDSLVLRNVWHGVTIENKANIKRLNYLVATPSVKRFISIEPLLEPIEFDLAILKYIDWVIIGAESGTNRRTCKIEWVKDIIDQCKDVYLPVFVKQIQDDRGKLIKMPEIDGVVYNEYPQVI